MGCFLYVEVEVNPATVLRIAVKSVAREAARL